MTGTEDATPGHINRVPTLADCPFIDVVFVMVAWVVVRRIGARCQTPGHWEVGDRVFRNGSWTWEGVFCHVKGEPLPSPERPLAYWELLNAKIF